MKLKLPQSFTDREGLTALLLKLRRRLDKELKDAWDINSTKLRQQSLKSLTLFQELMEDTSAKDFEIARDPIKDIDGESALKVRELIAQARELGFLEDEILLVSVSFGRFNRTYKSPDPKELSGKFCGEFSRFFSQRPELLLQAPGNFKVSITDEWGEDVNAKQYVACFAQMEDFIQRFAQS
jgi:hypothetical protein